MCLYTTGLQVLNTMLLLPFQLQHKGVTIMFILYHTHCATCVFFSLSSLLCLSVLALLYISVVESNSSFKQPSQDSRALRRKSSGIIAVCTALHPPPIFILYCQYSVLMMYVCIVCHCVWYTACCNVV